MKFEKLGEFIYIPQREETSLAGKSNIRFNYYLSSRINGKLVDLDITTKIFDEHKLYTRKACYRVKLAEIESCVKANLVDHMRSLGVADDAIPKSLIEIGITSHAVSLLTKNAYS